MANVICSFDGGDQYEVILPKYPDPQVIVINKNTTFSGDDEDGPVNSWEDAIQYDEPARFIEQAWAISVSDLLEFYLKSNGLDIEEL